MLHKATGGPEIRDLGLCKVFRSCVFVSDVGDISFLYAYVLIFLLPKLVILLAPLFCFFLPSNLRDDGHQNSSNLGSSFQMRDIGFRGVPTLPSLPLNSHTLRWPDPLRK